MPRTDPRGLKPAENKGALSGEPGKSPKKRKHSPDPKGGVVSTEPLQEIGMESVRKARRFKVLALAALVTAILCAGAFYMLQVNGTNGRQTSCWRNELAAEQAAQSYVKANGFSSAPAYLEDIPGFDMEKIKCPDGGEYTWNPVTGELSCSEHGHHPSSFGAAQNQNLGTTTSSVSNNISNKG